MLTEYQILTDFVGLSVLLLALAFVVPIVGLTYGSSRGVPLPQLGGVIVSYWGFLLLSMIPCGLGILKHDSGALQLAVALIILAAVPPGIKFVKSLTTGPGKIDTPFSEQKSADLATKPAGCLPKLANHAGPITDSKSGKAGTIAWHFWIGNGYEWNLDVKIEADDHGVSGTASASGKMSPWYSATPRPRAAKVSARGAVDCESTADGCRPVPMPGAARKTDMGFIADVKIVATEIGGRGILDVTCSAEVLGTSALSLSAGPSVKGIGATVNLQGPNYAQDYLGKSQSYSYRCIRTP